MSVTFTEEEIRLKTLDERVAADIIAFAQLHPSVVQVRHGFGPDAAQKVGQYFIVTKEQSPHNLTFDIIRLQNQLADTYGIQEPITHLSERGYAGTLPGGGIWRR